MGRPALALAALLLLAAAASPAPRAEAVVLPAAPTAMELADAIGDPSPYVTGAAFEVLAHPNAVAVADDNGLLAGFPKVGRTFAILTTGIAQSADDPNTAPDTSAAHGTQHRGARDATVLRIDFVVPMVADCVQVSFRFLTEEYPEYVGEPFNDGFVAELDQSTWSVSGSTVNAPDNFAFTAGKVVSINTVPMTTAFGTTYDGWTSTATIHQPVVPGAHSLFLSVFDVGDDRYDSAVFVDGFEVGKLDGGPDPCVDVDAPELLYDYDPHGQDACGPVTFRIVAAPSGYTNPSWEFGDGGVSQEQSPTHQYRQAGLYTSMLQVLHEGRYVRVTLQVRIENCPPVARFSIAPTPYSDRVAVVADESVDPDSGCLLRWQWDFGNEARYTTQQPPEHRFTRLGTHTVRLVVADCQGTFSEPYELTFTAQNRHPFIDPVQPRSVSVGTLVTFQVHAWDPDGDPVTLEPLSLPPHASLPPVSGTASVTQTLLWATGGYAPGLHVLTFRARDSEGATAHGQAVVELFTGGPDADGDGVVDVSDTCPARPNRDQGGCAPPEVPEASPPPAGPAAAPPPPDQDRDGVPDVADNCPAIANPMQADGDLDGAGDVCDLDADGDGMLHVGSGAEALDNCPSHTNPDQADRDGDGIGDACDGGEPDLKLCAEPCSGQAGPRTERLTSAQIHLRRASLLAGGMVGGVLIAWAAAEALRRRRGPA